MIAPNLVGEVCLTLKQQEIPFDDSHSTYRFRKPFHATPGAIEMFSPPVLVVCLVELQELAVAQGGLDYLQVYETKGDSQNLWFIEDAQVVTALLPSEY